MARQRFVELIAQGVPFRVAAIEVGVSRSAAQIWKNGTLAAWELVRVDGAPEGRHGQARATAGTPPCSSELAPVPAGGGAGRVADMASRGDGRL